MTLMAAMRKKFIVMDVCKPDFCPVENDKKHYLLIDACANHGKDHIIVKETFILGIKWFLFI